MKLTSLLGRARVSLLAFLGLVSLAVSFDASAIPIFARQTGFKCVACHVGGMYPQLTSLGRMFKLTGYTLGNANDIFNLTTNIDRPPVAVMVQTARQYYANTKNYGTPGAPATINGAAPSSAMDAQVFSVFAGGHITDNFGAFLQFTAGKYSGEQTSTANPGSTSGAWTGGSDNSEFRYADRMVGKDSDLIYGVYLNNRVLMSDVWNNMGPWQSGWINYFNTLSGPQAPTTFLMGETAQHTEVGVGAYLFKDKTWYAEFAVHKSPTHGPFSFLTSGNPPSNTFNGSNGTVIDPSPFLRLAYNKEWGPESFEVGLHAMTTYAHGINQLTGSPQNSDYSAPVSTYRDIGLDAQYQYVLDPHYFAAHARITRETMNNAFGSANYAGATASNPTDNLTETYADVTYIYKAKYGALLQYQGATGSNDLGLYGMNTVTGSPDWSAWTPNIFWAPVQNVRIGYMYTFYTKMGGTTGNQLTFSGASVSPHDFNTSMVYATLIY